MKTQAEIESAISEGMSRFEQQFMGRAPKDVRAYLIDDLIVVRLKGVLTAAEQHLVQTLPTEKGRDLLKEMRRHLIETARADHGGNDTGDHRCGSGGSASRHQYSDRRKGRAVYPDRVANCSVCQRR